MPAHLGERRQCERCDTEIVFLRHRKTGHLAPIEAQPVQGGRFQVDWSANTYQTVAGVSKDGTQFSSRTHGQDYYENHYVRCPGAQFFRDRSAAAEQNK